MKKNKVFVFLVLILFMISTTANIGFTKDKKSDKDKDNDKIEDKLEQEIEKLKKLGLHGEKIPLIISVNKKNIQEVRDTIKDLHGDIIYEYEIIDAVAAFVPAKNVELLASYDYVSFIDADAEVNTLTQTTPWGISRINAPSAWSTSTGLGADVAVLDTGIEPLHEDLAQNIEFGISFSRGRVSTAQQSWGDKNGHGSHVAGTIAALNNDLGVVGVAHSTGLYAVRVLDRNGNGFISDVIAGIDWSVKGPDNIINTSDDAEVISMSLGTSSDIAEFENAVDNAYTQGVVIVAAAGNSGDGNPLTQEISYPAAYSSVIAVGATNINNTAPFWSNSGNYSELAAPGVSILSTYLEDGYVTLSGTSMAAPHVSGVVALIRSYNPSLTPEQIRTILQSTATDLGTVGWDSVYGYGLVNAFAAIRAVINLDYMAVNIDNVTNRNVFQDPFNDGGGDFSIGELYGYPYPIGNINISDVPFNLTENIIILNGGYVFPNGTLRSWQDAWNFPQKENILVEEKINEAYFIHASGWTAVPYGTTIANYIFHYNDGTNETVELKKGINIDEINRARFIADNNTHAFYCFRNPKFGAYEFEMFTYKLSKPNVTTDFIEFVDAGNSPAPVLAALTVKKR